MKRQTGKSQNLRGKSEAQNPKNPRIESKGTEINEREPRHLFFRDGRAEVSGDGLPIRDLPRGIGGNDDENELDAQYARLGAEDLDAAAGDELLEADAEDETASVRGEADRLNGRRY